MNTATEKIRKVLKDRALAFRENELIHRVELPFSIYDIEDRLRTALFVDNCMACCPIHGRGWGAMDMRSERAYSNKKLVAHGVMVIRSWECTARVSPDSVVDRVEFSVNRPPRFLAYCSVLQPKGIGR